MVKVTQINLHHFEAASAALLLRVSERGEELALIQEPWIHREGVRGLCAKVYKQLYMNGSGNIRSCIVASNNLNIFILSDYSDEGTVVAAWETGVGTILVISSYMEYDNSEPPPNIKVRDIVERARVENLPVIIGTDANAHHVVWGSSDTNARG